MTGFIYEPMLVPTLEEAPSKPAEPDVVDDLRNVLRLIEKGWTRGRPYLVYRGQEKYCLLGAIGRTVNNDPWEYFSSSTYPLRDAIQKTIGHEDMIFSFNDEAWTKRTVTSMLKKTIKREERRAR